MAELCTAFKRIVPRYQFSTNQAAFVVEDMHDTPERRIPPIHSNGPHKCVAGWNAQSPCGDRGVHCGKTVNVCGVPLGNRPYGMYVHRKCHWNNAKRCTSMDTCGNVKDKMCYYHKHEY
jgi:hypothetical protein